MERVTLGLLKESYLFLVFLRDECVKRIYSTPNLGKRTAKSLKTNRGTVDDGNGAVVVVVTVLMVAVMVVVVVVMVTVVVTLVVIVPLLEIQEKSSFAQRNGRARLGERKGQNRRKLRD